MYFGSMLYTDNKIRYDKALSKDLSCHLCRFLGICFDYMDCLKRLLVPGGLPVLGAGNYGLRTVSPSQWLWNFKFCLFFSRSAISTTSAETAPAMDVGKSFSPGMLESALTSMLLRTLWKERFSCLWYFNRQKK